MAIFLSFLGSCSYFQVPYCLNAARLNAAQIFDGGYYDGAGPVLSLSMRFGLINTSAFRGLG
jgi:hypothetical protein